MQRIQRKDILFIINPHSGKKNARSVVAKLSQIQPALDFIITHNLEELAQAFEKNIEKYKVFVLVGGDGTINEALQYIYPREDKILAILPAGSGNGFSRELGFSKSVHSLLEDISRGEYLDVDLLAVNNQPCINAAGVGLDSFVAHQFSKRKSRGFINYVYCSLKSFFTFKPFKAQISVDNQQIAGRYLMITIANTRQYGNNALIAPQAQPHDGVFEVVLVKPFPIYLYPLFIVRLFFGHLRNSKYVRYIPVENAVEIKADFKKYHIDGEPKTCDGQLKIAMQQHKIRILKTALNQLPEVSYTS